MQELLVQTSDGRELAAAVTGDPDGTPIVFHHGTPGTMRAHNLAASAIAGARVIVYDRPGYGRSSSHPDRDVAAGATDAAAIADALDLDRFAVFGSSGGGPHALACGAVLGDRVSLVAVIAGFAPGDDPLFDPFEGMSNLNIEELRAAAVGRGELTELLQELARTASDPDEMLDEIAAELSSADRTALARPEVRAVFSDAIGASLRGGLDGWIDDDLAFMRPWGFDLAEIAQPTLLMQGELDVLVPRPHMAYLASRIPHARLEIIEGGGHTLFDETRDVVDWVLANSG